MSLITYQVIDKVKMDCEADAVLEIEPPRKCDQWYCIICQRMYKRKSKPKHVRSKTHQKLFETSHWLDIDDLEEYLPKVKLPKGVCLI
jgi:hypothetical protein